MSLPVSNSAISVRFNAEVEPTDSALKKAVQSNLFYMSGNKKREQSDRNVRPRPVA